jgi:hypothetical protein
VANPATLRTADGRSILLVISKPCRPRFCCMRTDVSVTANATDQFRAKDCSAENIGIGSGRRVGHD